MNIFLGPSKVLVLISLSAFGTLQSIAAPFQNLDFELARTNSLSVFNPQLGSGFGRVVDLLPGWEVHYTGNNSLLLDGWVNFKVGSRFETIGFNAGGTGSRAVASLTDPRFFTFVEGNYSMWFFFPDWSLKQTGSIPLEARTLSYKHIGKAFSVSVNGEEIWPKDEFAFPQCGVTTISVDIARFAGQTVDLEFHITRGGPVGCNDMGGMIDSITFTVPEPSTYALLMLGASLLGGRCWWQRRKRAIC